MRKLSARVFLLLSLISFYLNSIPGQIFAADLAVTTVKLDRHKISVSTGGLVCITTPNTDNGTENNIQVIFPSGFNVNSTASNWTTNTTNIPTDATAWPGIGTATTVSGQIITFPSGDLSQNTKYCFNFSGTNTLTTPSSTGNYEGHVRTRATATIIDSHAFGLSVVNNDQINVTATVAADPTDFEAELELTDPTISTFSQDTILTFTLTYGSNLSYATSITPEISWDLGTISGGGSPTVNLLDYVVGSASNAYGGTAPVIDTINRTISWEINSFPASTIGETVTFQLKTNDEYSGPLTVDFSVNGRVLGPGTQTADSTVDLVYQYEETIVPTPTPKAYVPGANQGDGLSDGKSDGGASTPQGPFAITEVDIRTISPTSASIFVLTNQNSNLTVKYGTSPNNLNQTLNLNQKNYQYLVSLQNLSPSTRYYFQLTATNLSGSIFTSDLFTFITAADSDISPILLSDLIILSENIILYDPTHANSIKNNLPYVVIPTDIPFSLKFKASNPEQIKNISILARDKEVLGINNFTNISPDSYSNSLLETSSGQFTSSLKTNQSTGEYYLIAKVEDFSGNVREVNLAVVRVTKPMMVIEKGNRNPIENARAAFYIYNSRTKLFDFIESTVISIKNPNFSEPDGHMPIVLPSGRFRVEVESFFYEKKTVEFTIGLNDSDGYPEIQLERQPFSLVSAIGYFKSILDDLMHSFNFQLTNLSNSNRFFDFSSFLALILFSLLLLLALIHKFGVPLLMLPWLALYSFKKIAGKHEHIIQGIVIDSKTQEGISGVTVYISLTNGKIASHTRTNTDGEFFATSPDTSVKLTTSHKEYKNYSHIYTEAQTKKRITIQIYSMQKNHFFSLDGFAWYMRFIFASLLEAFIFITILLEFILMPKFGAIRVLPFIILSIFSLVLWASMHRNKRVAQENGI